MRTIQNNTLMLSNMADNKASILMGATFVVFSIAVSRSLSGEVLTRLEQDETVYRTMLHDIYQNGQVLHRRKYRYLAYSYHIFVAGLLATLVTFVGEFVLSY